MAGEETTRWRHRPGHLGVLRAAGSALEQEVLRARRHGRGLSVVILDIDEFGGFNTSFGHTLGDRVLRAVAMTLAASIAPPEMVARYGGDEFTLLLPETNRAVAVELIASIVNRLAALSVFEGPAGERQGISASVAIVSYPEDGGSREELLAAAELGVEQAKAEHRAALLPERELTAVQKLRAGKRQGAA
jgi:diguanylate cyclase (GGDEF)-like protein